MFEHVRQRGVNVFLPVCTSIERMDRPTRLFVCLEFMCVYVGEGCVVALCLSGGVCLHSGVVCGSGISVLGWSRSGREDATVGSV